MRMKEQTDWTGDFSQLLRERGPAVRVDPDGCKPLLLHAGYYRSINCSRDGVAKVFLEHGASSLPGPHATQ